MSRIGKQPVKIPEGVTVVINQDMIVVKGNKGELTASIPKGIKIDQKDKQIEIVNKDQSRDGNAIFGLIRSIISNNIIGVSREWSKTLEMTGVGYRANIQGQNLVLSLGFSHDVIIKPEAGVRFEVKEGKIIVTGIDKQKVGQAASDIRSIRPPEPYKGKGIHYLGERIRRKAGKAAKAVGGAK